MLRDGSFASAGRDGTICRWAVNTDASTVRGSIDLQAGSVTCLVEDGHGRIWSGTRAGEIWCLAFRGRTRVRVAGGLAAITSATRDGDIVAFTTSRGEVVAVRIATSSDVESPDVGLAWITRAHDGWVWGIAAHGDGFVSCGHDGRVMRVDRRGHAQEWAALGMPLRAIASHGTSVVVGDDRGWLHWLARDGHIVRAQRAHAATVTAIAIAGDSVVSAGEDGRVMQTHARGSDMLIALDDFVTSVAVASTSEVIVAGYDGCIRRVAVSDGRADRAAF